ncbi:serine acetyltransferase 3 [Klebsormidium nitens]|uniref:serine O-acetyltransferase n=1 Tax=Klebsormidium nitens TaxID=105231 RepID=A0A1Y1HSZ5_KLENI|nr:serine acetyltransferase 3 [Klebsormidium nitens]|eukprot:GAQ81745.1 serine acetyltransferase 3 [Klebsormidium nitens]
MPGNFSMTLLQGRKAVRPPSDVVDPFWALIRNEAQQIIADTSGGSAESALMSDYVSESIVKWATIEEALANHLAEKLGTAVLSAAKWRPVLTRALAEGKHASGLTLGEVVQKDLETIRDRDPACPSFAHAFLHFKGFLGLQAHRASHWLWTADNKKPLASLIQARISEAFAMDIHPAARIGVGVLIDHATGVVIGETAAVGDGCTLLHGVTLGGTGKETEDRHPKLGKNVLVGAGASILGNVKIGEGAKVGAAALVLTDIPAHATAVGSPAKVVGRSKEDSPASKMDQICKNVYLFPKKAHWFCPFRTLDVAQRGFLSPQDVFEKLKQKNIDVSISDVVEIFFKLDTDHNGQITEQEFQQGYDQFLGTLKKHGSFKTIIAKLGCDDSIPENKPVLF